MEHLRKGYAVYTLGYLYAVAFISGVTHLCYGLHQQQHILLFPPHYCVQQLMSFQNTKFNIYILLQYQANPVYTLSLNIHLFNFPLSTCCTPKAFNIIQLLTFVEINIRIYRSKINDV
jgi:hypothetical protein